MAKRSEAARDTDTRREALRYGDPRCVAFESEGFNVPKKNLGLFIGRGRKKGWSNKALAARLGVNEHVVSEWISGKRYMTDKYVAMAARVLGVHPLVLLDWLNIGEDCSEEDYCEAECAYGEEGRANVAFLCDVVSGKEPTAFYDGGEPTDIELRGRVAIIKPDAVLPAIDKETLYREMGYVYEYGEAHNIGEEDEFEIEEGVHWRFHVDAWHVKDSTESGITERNLKAVKGYPADLRDLRHLLKAVLEDAAQSANDGEAVRLLDSVAREVQGWEIV